MAEIKILIVDDHEMVRNGLSVMMERGEDFIVVGEAQNGKEAVELVSKLRPDVVPMDLRMTEMDGVEAMRQIRAKQDDVNFLVLTTYDTDEYIFDAIQAGAKGYLLKDASREELFRAVRTVNRGGVLDRTRRDFPGFGPVERTISPGCPRPGPSSPIRAGDGGASVDG